MFFLYIVLEKHIVLENTHNSFQPKYSSSTWTTVKAKQSNNTHIKEVHQNLNIKDA